MPTSSFHYSHMSPKPTKTPSQVLRSFPLQPSSSVGNVVSIFFQEKHTEFALRIVEIIYEMMVAGDIICKNDFLKSQWQVVLSSLWFFWLHEFLFWSL